MSKIYPGFHEIGMGMRVEDLFKTYYIQLMLYVYRIVRIKSVAEDIVQDTFLKLLEQPSHENLEIGYLYTSVKNKALNYLRDTKRLTDEENIKNLCVSVVDIEEELAYTRQLQQVYAAIETLPVSCRLVFKEVYLKKKKYEEVAVEKGVSVNTIKSHMYVALATLKKKLKKTE